MAESITPNAISTMMANPSPVPGSEIPDLVVQALELKPVGTNNNRYMCNVSDGQTCIKTMFSANLTSQITLGNLQSSGLIRILDYVVNEINSIKCLTINKFEVVVPVVKMEIKDEVQKPNVGIILKPKQETFSKSANQIMHEQNQNMPPMRRAMTRRVQPLIALNPYHGGWTIKVKVTNKGTVREYTNARGRGQVFNVELTDEDGTEIQATMFNDAVDKFHDKFQMGKVYYISKGTLRLANRQFKTLRNDYEMTLNMNSEVEEVGKEGEFNTETKFNFVPIDQLGPYVNGKLLVDVVGVVQSVSNIVSVKRKINNVEIPKCDITIADQSNKTVVVSFWNELADSKGQELFDMVQTNPVVAIKAVKVAEFKGGISLSALSKSTVLVNPDDVPETKKLRAWYASEGKEATMSSLGAGTFANSEDGDVYSDRVCISHIINNPSLGEGKPAKFNLKAYICQIPREQAMSYLACNTCNRKVTEVIGSGYRCEGCQKDNVEIRRRYIMNMKVTDHTGEVYVSLFDKEAEKIFGCPAEELNNMKNGDEDSYSLKLKQVNVALYAYQVSVAPRVYREEKRQRVTVNLVEKFDFAKEARMMLEDLEKM